MGAGVGGGWDFLESAIDEATSGAVDIGGAVSFNARGGYRFASWFAFEAMYEGIYGMRTDIAGFPSGDLTTHSLVGNFKFFLPFWRVQPYFSIGPGAQYAEYDSFGPIFELLVPDENRWDFVMRFGLGIDAYINENWLVNLEIAPAVRLADYGTIPSEITDNVSMTFGAGVQYRF
jgi:opacity protein-like surface antigen